MPSSSQKDFEIEVIRDEEMENVQIFDAFINMYEKILEDIRTNDKPEELIVNVSSGSPAMKSSLQMLSFLHNDIIAIQVSTPAKSSNTVHENKNTYDLQLQWEFNEDRVENFENRCMISGSNHLSDRIRKESIQKQISVYDYEAVKILVSGMVQPPKQKFLDCLEIAIARCKLDLKYVNQHREKYGLENWFPIIQEREMKEFEYLLVMQTKLFRKQYVDFMRDITPIYYSISEKLMEKYCGLKFRDIGEKVNDVWKLSLTKTVECGLHFPSGWKDFSSISAYMILMIMRQKCKNEDVLHVMEDVRVAEEKVRNLAAHEIVGVTYDWIVNKIKFKPEEVMEKLFELAEYAGIHVSKQNRKVYDVMNQDLIHYLQNY